MLILAYLQRNGTHTNPIHFLVPLSSFDLLARELGHFSDLDTEIETPFDIEPRAPESQRARKDEERIRYSVKRIVRFSGGDRNRKREPRVVHGPFAPRHLPAAFRRARPPLFSPATP